MAGMRKTPVLVSLIVHACFVALLLLLSVTVATPPKLLEIAKSVTPLVAPPLPGKISGGGQRSSLPATKGDVPPAPRHKIFIPPVQTPNPTPALPIDASILLPPDVVLPAATFHLGDPFAKAGIPSGGSGIDGAGGPGRRGVGPGDGAGCCGGPIIAGHSGSVTGPKLIYHLEPEYSEEARKARFQGTVVLMVEVGQDGKAHNLRIVRSLGLGLDEKALEAVAFWRFRPALADGKPITARATIEVNFRLL